jgi:hypothetical protein
VAYPKTAIASGSGTAGFAILGGISDRMLLTVGGSTSSAEVRLSQTSIISGERYALVGLSIDIPYI